MKTLISWLRYLRVPGQILTRKPRGSGGCRSLTSETGIIEADGPASANERTGQPEVTNQRRGRPIMGADSAWAWELATNRFTAVLWETVLDILHCQRPESWNCNQNTNIGFEKSKHWCPKSTELCMCCCIQCDWGLHEESSEENWWKIHRIQI